MPVTLVDRLPLPNLKVYTAGSVSLLSIAVYYALTVTSDPNWRVNATLARQDAMDPGEAERLVPAPLPLNGTRNVSEQFVDVMTFMMQEPLCMWTLINIAYCSLAVFGFGVQRVVFGQLRVAEAQRVKDKFWNYVFYKFIFVFGVINVQYMDEVLLWCSWFTLVGFLHLLGQLCKDRYEYILVALNFYARGSYQGSVGQNDDAPMAQQTVSRCIREVSSAINTPTILRKYIKFPQNATDRNITKRKFYEKYNLPGVIGCIDCTHIAIVRPSEHEERFFNRKHFHSINTQVLSSSPNTGGWAHVRLASLLGGILAAATALLGAAAAWGLPAGRDTFAFMAAECILVLVSVLHVVARYVLQLYEADVAGPVAYYTHLVFDSVSLVVELLHVLHMVVYSNMLVSMASLVLLMQLRHLLHELQARVRRHRLYTELATHMSRNYPMASKEEVEKNQDNCAICWEPMKEARKLPCSHLFHNSCLCQWVQQDASCPTCRRALAAAARPRHDAAARHPNHLFHFDGSRYVSWLPSFSVEVTRVRPDAALAGAQLDAAAAQLQLMFPQYSRAALAGDLARTRSADLTLDNILEGRLPEPAETLPPEPAALPEAAPEPEPTPAPAPSPPAPVLADAATLTAPRFRPPPRSPSPPPALELDDSPGRFPRSAAAREAWLARRKLQLVAEARRRYLSRRAPPSQSAPAPHAPPPH